jgi:aldehyde:ferredoxin oxidoreductase
MGSKNLRAIAVRGTMPLKIFDKEKLREITKNINKKVLDNLFSQRFRKYGTTQGLRAQWEIGCLPTRNWTTGLFDAGENLSGEMYRKTILKKEGSCYACSVRCKRIVEINDDDVKVDPLYGGPEYEAVVALGSLCGIADLRYIAKGNELCNKYCIDTISTGNAIAFAMKCYEEGLLTRNDTYGIDLRFGNETAMLKMIEKIGRKEKGLGAILSEGSVVAASIIGRGSDRFIHHVKGQEIPMHDPRVKTGLGFQYAFSDNGADHMKAPHDGFFIDDESYGTDELRGLGALRGVPLTDLGPEKVKLFKIIYFYGMVLEILCVCRFLFAPLGPGSLEDLVDIIHSITGWRVTWYELMRLAERSINMARIFNINEGFGSAQDTIPDVFFTDFKDGPLDGKNSINREEFIKARSLWYAIMGWNEKGIPTNQKLLELDLDWLSSGQRL